MQHQHGGDLEGYRRKYGREPLDFSANVSPLGLPEGVARAAREAVGRSAAYPDPACRRLCEAISAHDGVPAEDILCGNGAAELIFRLAAALRPRRALLTAPCFYEYEAALTAAGCELEFHALRPENGFRLTPAILGQIRPGLSAVFLCQPNNPTGQAAKKPLLLEILRACRDCGTVLALDECFVPFLDDPAGGSLLEALGENENLVLLRAFTKLYAMPGLRLGYALSSGRTLLSAMRAAGQSWSVSVPAQEAGVAALQEADYVRRARALVGAEKPYLRAALTQAGAAVIGSDANYLFFRSPDTALCEKLAARGILLRDCGNFRGLGPGYCRAAVRCHADNRRLAEAVREVLNG